MATILFFHMVLRKFMENTDNKPIYSQYNIFHKYKYFFSIYVLISFSIISKKVNQIRNNASHCVARLVFGVLLCTHCEALQCFSTYFCKSKEIGVLRPIFPIKDRYKNHHFEVSRCTQHHTH